MPDDPGNLLADDAELLFHQVHPCFVRDGRVGSQGFRPTPKDDRKLSVDRGTLATAQAAFELHAHCLSLASDGTWGVTVGECRALSLGCRPDPVEHERCPDHAHAIVDFTGLSNRRSRLDGRGARGPRVSRAARRPTLTRRHPRA